MAWINIEWHQRKSTKSRRKEEPMRCTLSKLGTLCIMDIAFCLRTPESSSFREAIRIHFFFCIHLVDGWKMMTSHLTLEWDSIRLFLTMEHWTQITLFCPSGHRQCTTVDQTKSSGTLPQESTLELLISSQEETQLVASTQKLMRIYTITGTDKSCWSPNKTFSMELKFSLSKWQPIIKSTNVWSSLVGQNVLQRKILILFLELECVKWQETEMINQTDSWAQLVGTYCASTTKA